MNFLAISNKLSTSAPLSIAPSSQAGQAGPQDSSKELPSPSASDSFQPDAAQDIAPSPYRRAATATVQVLKEIPDSSDATPFRKVFLEGESLTQFRQDMMKSLKEKLKELKDGQNLLSLLENPNISTPRKLYTALLEQFKRAPSDKVVAKLKEEAGLWQAMEDFSRLHADGLGRSCEHYLSPAHLALATASLGWDIDEKSKLPIADAVVVGGGPGGLSTTYQLSELGARTVLFEAGKFGQGFSDAHAQSVHQLRTSGDTSNLIYVGSPVQLGIDISMPRHLQASRAKCDEARTSWNQAIGEKEHGVSDAQGGDRSRPANRSEFFDHMSSVALGLAQHYPNTFLSENSPVQAIEKVERNGESLFAITTEQGHKLLTRSLVMATGFVGTDGEYARTINDFKEAPSALTLQNESELFTKGEDLLKLQNELDQGKVTSNLVMSERMLGRQELRQVIKKLPPGARVAVIGGGESATKGALEVLALNEGIGIDIYTSKPLEPYQTQIPTSTIHPAIAEKGIANAEVAKRTQKELVGFETPITPETMLELLEAERLGRVRIREMGERFSAKSVAITSTESPRGQAFKLSLKSDSAANALTAQRENWLKVGLYDKGAPADSPVELPDTDLVIVAAGYDKKALQAGPLMQQLIDQDLIEFSDKEIHFGKDGLSSSKNPMLYFNTAGVTGQAADSAIPGRAIRAYRLSQNLAAKLPAREKPSDPIASKLPFPGVDMSDDSQVNLKSDEWAWAFLDNEGMTDQAIAQKRQQAEQITDPAKRQEALQALEIERRFPAANGVIQNILLRELKDEKNLSPLEAIIAERANRLSERIYTPK